MGSQAGSQSHPWKDSFRSLGALPTQVAAGAKRQGLLQADRPRDRAPARGLPT
jgi:hypothetical protein